MNVNDEVKKEVVKDLDAAVKRLSKVQKEYILAKEEVSKLTSQVNCSHIWVPDGNHGRLGGYDSDICTKCGRVWEY